MCACVRLVSLTEYRAWKQYCKFGRHVWYFHLAGGGLSSTGKKITSLSSFTGFGLAALFSQLALEFLDLVVLAFIHNGHSRDAIGSASGALRLTALLGGGLGAASAPRHVAPPNVFSVLTTPATLIKAGWDTPVRVLDAAVNAHPV